MDNRTIIKIENARITYRNFSGEERTYNKKGNRNFNLVLTPEMAKKLSDDGFNVRVKDPKNEGGEVRFLLPVHVAYAYRPPRVVIIRGSRKYFLNEDTIGELDSADISNIDLTIRPYFWKMPNGDHGVKAQLNSLYATIVEDPFESKYFGDDEETPF